jgi:hypothetical protein
VTIRDTASPVFSRPLLGVAPVYAIWLGAFGLCVGVALLAGIPATAAYQICTTAIIPAWWLMARHGALPWPHDIAHVYLLAALGTWMFASAMWAPVAASALHIGITLLLYMYCVGTWNRFLAESGTGTVSRRLGDAVLIGFAIAAPLICFEAVTNLAGSNALSTAFPSLRPNPHHMSVDSGGTVAIHVYMLNRNVTALLLLAWPALLIAHGIVPREYRDGVLALLAALTVLTVVAGHHASSRLALAAGIAMFVLASWRLVFAHRAALAVWTILCLLVVPLAGAAYKAELYKMEMLPYSAAHRVLIWGYTANDVLRHPLLGAGAASTRYIEQAEPPAIVRTAKFEFPVSVNYHAHNVYLQVWFELGAIGALLFWFAGRPVIAWIATAAAAVRPAIYAAWATAAAMASTSYSFTDPWFMGFFCLMAVFTRLAVSLRP